MYRIAFLFSLILVLFLSGCAGFGVDSSHFPEKRPATGRRVFVFDPNYPAWAAYDEEGNRVRTGRASGGKDFCPDIGRPCRTLTGTFRILSKGDSECKSGRYPVDTNGGAPMPYCMLFHPKGYAIHGTYGLANYNNSHGCIGVTTDDAEWLNQYFLRIGSTVVVKPYHPDSE